MDKLMTYRELIKRSRHDGTTVEHVFDEANNHYLLLQFGWNKDRRVYRTELHLRLSDGKIWIETDETEEGIATALVRAGVPREEIVLAFHPLELRHLTEFAAA
jgi:XisI protein